MRESKINKLISVFLLLISCQVVMAKQGYSNLFVFGDSLSDTGNVHILTEQSGFPIPVPPSSRYYNGRFSNGFNTAEIVWASMGNVTSVSPVMSLSLDKLNLKKLEQTYLKFDDLDYRKKMFKSGRKIIDGKGVERIGNIMEKLI